MSNTQSHQLLTELPLTALLESRPVRTTRTTSNTKWLSQFPGMRLSSTRGQGLEFDDLREYSPGDDTRYIDWNVTARTGRLYTRLYKEERERATTIVIDMRPCMFTGTAILKIVGASLLAAKTLWQSCEMGDRCSAVVFSNSGIKASRPAAGSIGALDACQLIATEFARIQDTMLQPANRNVNADQDADLLPLFQWLNNSSRSLGASLLFSGLDGLESLLSEPTDTLMSRRAKDPASILSVTGLRKRTTVVMVLDPVESKGLPPGQYHAQFNGNRFLASLDSAGTEQLNSNLRQSITHTQHILSKHDIQHLTILSDSSYGELEKLLHSQRFF